MKSQKGSILLSFFLLAPLLAFCQASDTGYIGIKSVGDLPNDFLELSSEKYLRDKYNIDNDARKQRRKLEEEFYLTNNFRVDEILLSGMVVFNDPISNYASKVADEILKNEPELRKELRFYTLRSPTVNAFATDKGIMFINVGLLAQLENEAQLAFILCHEFSHYINRHSQSKFEAQKRVEENEGLSRDFDYTEKMMAHNNYSREIEMEADEYGLELFLKTDYSLEEVFTGFDVLQFSDLPFSNHSFDGSIFESANYQFPDDYLLEETAPLLVDEVDNEYSTHPSVPKRKVTLKVKLQGREKDKNEQYVVSQEEFKRVQKIARFETCRMNLNYQQYEQAVYQLDGLIAAYPQNLYLKQSMAEALLGLVKYANEGKFYRIHMDYEDIMGESQQLHHFVEKLYTDEVELNIVTVHYIWNTIFNSPQSDVLDSLGVQALNELMTTSLSHEELEGYNPDSTYVPGDTSKPYYSAALYELFQKEAFRKAFTKAEELNKALVVPAYDFNEERKNRHRGYALGIDKIVIMEPFYNKSTVDGQKQQQNYLESEEGLLKLLRQLQYSAHKAGLKTNAIASRGLEKGDTEMFNEISLLTAWADEQNRHPDEVTHSTVAPQELAKLIAKYDTPYFLWTGVVSAKVKPRALWASIGGGILFPPAIPSIITKGKKTVFYSILYNIETAEVLFSDYHSVNELDKREVLNSYLYSLFTQIKFNRDK